MTDREKLKAAWDDALVALDAARDAYAVRDALDAASDAQTLYDARADARVASAAVRDAYAVYNAILAAQEKEPPR